MSISIRQLASFRLIPVLRYHDKETALKAGRIIAEAGHGVIELTMTTPGALQVVKVLAEEFPTLILGVGSLFSTEEMKEAADAGAHFFVSPHLDLTLLKQAQKLETPYLPGTLTPSEIASAQREGAEGVKVFPVHAVGGAGYVRSLLPLFKNLFFFPTGGVNEGNVQEYLSIPETAVGTTSLLTPQEMEKQDTITLIHLLRQRYFEHL